MKNFVIGIDIGGTSIKGGIVNLEGKILKNFSIPFLKNEAPNITLNKIVDTINSFVKNNNYSKDQIIGIGIGSPGAINSKKGTVDCAYNLNWHNVKICDFIHTNTGIPCKITNDANAAVLGEWKFGAAKNFNNVVLLTLGTGVGGGLIIDGKLFEGNDGKGVELGHISLYGDKGRKCTCGRRGCNEAYVSATGLIKTTKIIMKQYPDSIIWKLVSNDIKKVDGKTAFDACKANDEAGIKIINLYIKQLGETILNFCNIFRPDIILLSGGIAKQEDYLVNRLVKYCEEHDYGFKGTPKVKIGLANLGYDSGIIGAASLFIE